MPQHHHYQIQDSPQPFRIVSAHPREVAMEWLATKETGEEVILPPLFLFVDDLDDDKKGVVYLTHAALRQRDRERIRCCLSSYWEELAYHLESNSDYYKQRLVKKLEAV